MVMVQAPPIPHPGLHLEGRVPPKGFLVCQTMPCPPPPSPEIDLSCAGQMVPGGEAASVVVVCLPGGEAMERMGVNGRGLPVSSSSWPGEAQQEGLWWLPGECLGFGSFQ